MQPGARDALGAGPRCCRRRWCCGCCRPGQPITAENGLQAPGACMLWDMRQQQAAHARAPCISTAAAPPVSRAQEMEPMGTAGPLALARKLLDDGSGSPFFVLNRCAARTQRPAGRRAVCA